MPPKFLTPRGDEHHDTAAVDHIALAFETAMDRLIAELRPTFKGMELHAANSHPVSGANATLRPITGRGVLRGYGLRETTGAAGATVLLHAGADTSGHVIVPITLSPGESARDWFGDEGIALMGGLFVEITGAVDGSVYIGPSP